MRKVSHTQSDLLSAPAHPARGSCPIGLVVPIVPLVCHLTVPGWIWPGRDFSFGGGILVPPPAALAWVGTGAFAFP